MAEKKVAGWYWITTALLTPVALVSMMVWAYYANLSKSYIKEAGRIEQQLNDGKDEFDVLSERIKNVVRRTGYGDANLNQFSEEARTAIPAPPNAGANEDDPNKLPVLAKLNSARRTFYGNDETGGMTHEYESAKRFLDDYERRINRQIAYRSYLYYTIRGLNPDTTGGEAVAEGVITRPVNSDGSPQTEMDAAIQRWNGGSGEAPVDSSMQAPERVTLERVFRKQMALIDDLTAVNLLHYSILVSAVSGKVGENTVGYLGEKDRAEGIQRHVTKLENDIKSNRDAAKDSLNEAASLESELATEANVNQGNFENDVEDRAQALAALVNKYEVERKAHEDDAQRFRDLLRGIPRIKNVIKLEKTDPDGEVRMSDFTRKTVHIDLGSADGVVAGQRFEVWRLQSREADKLVGVIEVIRTLNRHYSLATVLELADEADPIHRGDKIVSRIWHDGAFLTIALHGTFEAPDTAYSKERLKKLLEQAGCKVVEKVQPSTDIVITGSNLFGDEWYIRAVSDIRFESIKERDIRLYIDPR
ncbi:MAG: hypothetical protein OEY28_14780 [Nitrospira sp.]|nr:hypothetical protein [Nitrospira sp.]